MNSKKIIVLHVIYTDIGKSSQSTVSITKTLEGCDIKYVNDEDELFVIQINENSNVKKADKEFASEKYNSKAIWLTYVDNECMKACEELDCIICAGADQMLSIICLRLIQNKEVPPMITLLNNEEKDTMVWTNDIIEEDGNFYDPHSIDSIEKTEQILEKFL